MAFGPLWFCNAGLASGFSATDGCPGCVHGWERSCVEPNPGRSGRSSATMEGLTSPGRELGPWWFQRKAGFWVLRRAGRGSTLGSRGQGTPWPVSRAPGGSEADPREEPWACVLTERVANVYFFPSYFAEVFACLIKALLRFCFCL